MGPPAARGPALLRLLGTVHRRGLGSGYGDLPGRAQRAGKFLLYPLLPLLGDPRDRARRVGDLGAHTPRCDREDLDPPPEPNRAARIASSALMRGWSSSSLIHVGRRCAESPQKGRRSARVRHAATNAGNANAPTITQLPLLRLVVPNAVAAKREPVAQPNSVTCSFRWRRPGRPGCRVPS